MKALIILLLTFQTCFALSLRDDDRDGIPSSVELEHDLHPLKASDAKLDKDGDGFTNLEEFIAGTNISNPKDFPPLATRLKLKEIKRIHYPFILKNVIDFKTPKGQITELNVYDIKLKKYLSVKLNETFLGNYKFIAYKEKEGKGFAIIEISKEKKLSLSVNNKKIFKEFKALFDYSMRGKITKLSLVEGEEFVLKNGKTSQTYLLESVQDRKAIVQNEREYEFSLPKKNFKIQKHQT